MLKSIIELFNLLSPKQNKRFFSLQVLVVLMAIFEAISIATIGPFIAMISAPSVIHTNAIINTFYNFLGSHQYEDFMFLFGMLVLTFLTFAALFSMFTVWRLSLFAVQVGTEIADQLYAYYLGQNWLFHANSSSAELTKKIATESMRVTDHVIQPLLQVNARLVLVLLIVSVMSFYNPVVTLTGLCIFIVCYIILFKVVRKKLKTNGAEMSEIMTERYRLMNEGFGGIKDVMLLNRSSYFISQFECTGEKFSYASGSNGAISQVPRYLMELIAFGSIIALTLFLLASGSQEISIFLPTLSVFALAGYKLLPALQQIYAGLTKVKGNIASFEAIRKDLIASQNQINVLSEMNPGSSLKTQFISLTKSIILKDLTFSYPGKAPLLKKVNMVIPAKKVVGVVGPSGSGKSTVIDLILGLIEPDEGALIIDGRKINCDNKRAWQNAIGFVPQSIFVSEGTIAENVAFGLHANEINFDQVKKALKLAKLEEMVQSLEQGIHTKVGEHGVRLSGGQRQRIGIARAMYHEAEVLVFDEATSALDGITEKLVMDAIHQFGGEKTIIIIAHRLKTIKKCDIIYMLDHGRVTSQGSYEELLKTNEQFKKMERHA